MGLDKSDKVLRHGAVAGSCICLRHGVVWDILLAVIYFAAQRLSFERYLENVPKQRLKDNKKFTTRICLCCDIGRSGNRSHIRRPRIETR